MKRGWRGGLLVALGMVSGLFASPLACSSSAGLSGQGGPCSQFSDCQKDLICGKGPNGTGVCTGDTSSLEPAQGQAGADAAGNPGNMAAGDASAGNDASRDSSSPAGRFGGAGHQHAG